MTAKPQFLDELPPPTNGPAYDWEKVSADLRSEPGKWVNLFTEGPVSIYSSLITGSNTVVNRSKGFEIKARNTKRHRDETGKETRTCSLWLRYYPKATQPPKLRPLSPRKRRALSLVAEMTRDTGPVKARFTSRDSHTSDGLLLLNKQSTERLREQGLLAYRVPAPGKDFKVSLTDAGWATLGREAHR